MAVRLVECHRVLKQTGSLFLHCDHSANAYLRMLLDAIFGKDGFRNEIAWCYTGPGNVTRHFKRKHDTILFYAKSKTNKFDLDAVRVPYSDETLARRGRSEGQKSIIAASVETDERRSAEEVDEKFGKGKVPEGWWTGITPLTNQAERTGYPTQKPVALAERIIKAASSRGDLVLDPFAGCATRDQLTTSGKIESRLRRLEHIDPATAVTPAGAYRLGWLQAFVDQDRAARSEIRRLERLIEELLDQHGTTLRDEHGIGPIAAATLVCEVGDPRRFDRESKFARWCGTGAVALSSGEGTGTPVKHRLDFRGNRRINSVLHIASVTQQRSQPDAAAYPARKTTEGKTRREARRAHKRQLANRVIRRMWRDENTRQQPLALAT